MAETRRPYIRPGFAMTHLANPIMRRLGIVPILAVRGRRSGKVLSVPIGKPLELGGVRYLVSGRGNTHWVRNLRAAGRGELRFHGSKEVFRAFEVTGRQREEVVRAYRKALGRSVAGYFERIPNPDEHPVFRMERIDATE